MKLLQKFISLILFFLISGLWVSCTDEFLNLPTDTAETRLCMSGFISEDSIWVVLTKSLPRSWQFNGSGNFDIDDTTGTIEVYEDNSFFCRLKPKSKIIEQGNETFVGYFYTSYKPVTEGKTYKIVASHSGYNSISAETIMPSKPQVLSTDTFSYMKKISILKDLNHPFDRTDTIVQYTSYGTTFQDQPGVNSFYMVKAFDIWNQREYYPLTMNDPIIEHKNPKCIFTDEIFNGKQYNFRFEDWGLRDTVDLKLYSISEDYYKYCVSVESLYEEDVDKYKEPVLYYSNVKNGYGIIGAYSTTRVRFIKKK